MLKLFWALALSVGFGAAAYSQNSLVPGSLITETVISGGAICDTEEEIREAWSHYGDSSYTFPDGCGLLLQPAAAQVYFVDYIDVDGLRFTLARYVFARGEVQFGMWGKPKPLGQGI